MCEWALSPWRGSVPSMGSEHAELAREIVAVSWRVWNALGFGLLETTRRNAPCVKARSCCRILFLRRAPLRNAGTSSRLSAAHPSVADAAIVEIEATLRSSESRRCGNQTSLGQPRTRLILSSTPAPCRGSRFRRPATHARPQKVCRRPASLNGQP